jgi:hypothetical protein
VVGFQLRMPVPLCVVTMVLTPSTCVGLFTPLPVGLVVAVEVYPGPWQIEHAFLCSDLVCPSGSEPPVTAWQAVHVVRVAVHVGAVAVPPDVPPLRLITAPWHHVEAQLPGVVPLRGRHVPFRRFALAAPVNATSFVPLE